MARNGLTPTEAGRTTLREFDLYTLSYQIKLQEWRFKASFQSWQNQTVQATEGKGKNVRPKSLRSLRTSMTSTKTLTTC